MRRKNNNRIEKYKGMKPKYELDKEQKIRTNNNNNNNKKKKKKKKNNNNNVTN